MNQSIMDSINKPSVVKRGDAARAHWSILYLLLRGTFARVIVLIFATAAVQVGLFYTVLQKELEAAAAGVGAFAPPETLIFRSGAAPIAGVGLILLSILLCSFGSGRTAGLALGRLRVEEKTIFWWQSLYNTLCYALLLVVQGVLMSALLLWYAKEAPAYAWSEQTLFLTFYRSGYLHGLLPLEEISRHLRNALLILSLGMCAAGYPYRRRKGHIPLNIVAMVAITLVGFCASLGSLAGDIIVMMLCCANVVELVTYIYRKEDAENAESNERVKRDIDA
ncbi:MAG: hypothetical protein IJW40_01750 [Clostridia bacterium]|nr:hypothetical protein [Clostridia bacterium]